MLLRQQNTTLRKTSETQTIEVRILASHAPALPKTSNVPGPRLMRDGAACVGVAGRGGGARDSTDSSAQVVSCVPVEANVP